MIKNWKSAFGSPLVVVAMAVALACVTAGPARAEDGGMKDPSTGMVWSSPISGWYRWKDASRLAHNYAVVEDGVTYDDWRVPTVAEMIAACEDGFLPAVLAANFLQGNFWSSETVSRTSARLVGIWYSGPDAWPWLPRFYAWYAYTAPSTSWQSVILVRGPQPPPSSHR